MARIYRSIRSALNLRWPYSSSPHGFWYLYHHI
jgi:hypothetical protein